MEESEYRALAKEEYDLLAWLMLNGNPEARKFLPLLETIEARSSCKCGCPSLEFSVPMSAPFIQANTSQLADFIGVIDGVDVGIALRGGFGVLSTLEVTFYGDITHPFGLPLIETLRLIGLTAESK